MSASTFFLGLVSVSAALSAIMAIAWLVWRSSRNSGWVDTIWTFGLGLVGFIGAVAAKPMQLQSILVAAMAAIWALRLGSHIARRTRGITDDPRYAKLIQDWGADASPRMFGLLQKQSIVSIPLALSMWLAANAPSPVPSSQAAIAILIFVVAVGGEAVADEQLRRFRHDTANKGRVCDIGLWRWSRHPNYFFEWLGWLAYPVLALDLTGGDLWGAFALLAPLCMYWLLVYVSGIPPLEEHMLAHRGEAFRRYQMTTNAFFPGPPKTFAGG
ncbi:steroid 5-alpha reductase family enzyme [Bradyrhizobium japonicum]